MSIIRDLVNQIIQKDFSSIAVLRDFLKDDPNYCRYLYRLDNAIGRYLTDIEHWKEQTRTDTGLQLLEGVTYENILGRDRFKLDGTNERFIDSIKEIFWRELYDQQTVIQTFYDYFKINETNPPNEMHEGY